MRERQNKTKEMLYLCIVIALIPYSFIALYCDAMMKHFSMIGYGFAIFCGTVLLKAIHTIKERFLVFCLSICSLLESYFLTKHFRRRVELLLQAFYCIRYCSRNDDFVPDNSIYDVDFKKQKKKFIIRTVKSESEFSGYSVGER